MKCVVVNFVGGPGSGKTAMCCLLFAELKMRGLSVEYVPEVAKSLVWTKQFDLLNNQHYVSMKQYEQLKAVYGKVSYVLTDGPLLHGIHYNKTNPENFCDQAKVEKLIIKKMSEFENIYIHVTQGNFTYEQAGRLETEEESKRIGQEVEKLLVSLQVSFHKIESGRNALPRILDCIMDCDDMKCKETH